MRVAVRVDLGGFKVVVAIGDKASGGLPVLGYKTIIQEWDVSDPSTGSADDESYEMRYSETFDDLLGRIRDLIH